MALKARGLRPDELVAALRTPSVRAAIESWEPDPATAARMEEAYRTTFVLGSPPEYEPGPERSLAGIAAATGRPATAIAYDAMLEDDGFGLLYVPILNYSDGNLDAAREMLAASPGRLGPRRRRRALRGHLRRVATHVHADPLDPRPGARRAPPARVDREEAVPRHRPSLRPRGPWDPRAGVLADLNLIDYERLELGNPRVADDLPAGGRRILQGATGYVETIKAGVTTFADGEETGARPGGLLRGAR